MKFGEKIRNLRKAQNMTQSELARRMDVTLRTVRGWELEGRYPKRHGIYEELADILQCEPSYLMTEDEYFIARADFTYGPRGRQQAEALVTELGGLFAGGELSEEDKDAVMRDLQEAYWRAKEDNRRKYTPHRYREQDHD